MSDMTLPAYEPFYLEDLDQLRAEIARLGLDLAVDEDLASLAEPRRVGDREAPNRFCALPVEGRDAEADGSPGPLTRRRYRRLAEGGFGIIWIEGTAVSVDARSHPAQLCLQKDNLGTFTAWISELREAARAGVQSQPVLILQLTHEGRVQRVPGDERDAAVSSDTELEELPQAFADAAALAVQAGFDGVDVRACPPGLVSDLLAGFDRPGGFGGDFEGRTRLLLETVMAIRRRVPDALPACRLNVFHAAECGFGVDREDYRRTDLAEPVRLVEELQDAGVSLLGLTAASPNLRGAMEERALRPFGDADSPDEHPLTVLSRHIDLARALRASCCGATLPGQSTKIGSGERLDRARRGPRPPNGVRVPLEGEACLSRFPHQETHATTPPISIVGTGYTWLRQFLPHVAAGAIRGGAVDFVGLGRAALACPDAPAAILRDRCLEPSRCCMVCFACAELNDYGGPVGCVIRDHETYGPVYRNRRRFDPDHLAAEAGRCHQCEAAPCTAACPAGTDIPAFIRAFARDDVAGAYEVIRRRDPLPELTSRLSPSWLESEGACIETTLTGRPVPSPDIQLTVSCLAREKGLTGVRLPARASGRRVAVVGGGPAGLAAAVRLLEQGHAVDLLEKTARLGGVPERVIPADRFSGAGPEIDATLKPALDDGRLRVRYGADLGRTVGLDELRDGFDAVLLATGLWQEPSLGRAEGVVAALVFLERAKQGAWPSKPGRVAVLAEGDTAMDAAVTARALGAEQVYVVFGGSRAELHWHLPDAWFATPGVHALMLCQPLHYETDDGGRVVGIRVCRTEPGERCRPGASAFAQELTGHASEERGPRGSRCRERDTDAPATRGTGILPVSSGNSRSAGGHRQDACATSHFPRQVPGGTPAPVPDRQSLLEVDLVIEAMGLEVADALRSALGGLRFSERGLVSVVETAPYSTGIDKVFVAGALINGGASVARCVAEGVAAAEEIDRCLS